MRQTALNMVHSLAQQDSRVVFVGSDLGAGTLDAMREALPEQFLMEGVAEQNLIGMAAGLAMDGFVPYVNTIATFLTRRCLEQVAIDACLHRLPLRLIGNGGGLVYAPLGPTHMAIEDIALMRALPNMTIVAPADAREMARFMEASLEWPGPIYIRVAKGGDEIVTPEHRPFRIGEAVPLRTGSDAAIVTTGVMAQRALAAAALLAERGVSCGVLHLPTVKPLDEQAVLELAERVEVLLTLEEHTLVGGLGSAVAEIITDGRLAHVPALRRLGIADCFTENYGSQEELLAHFHLTPESAADTIHAALDGRVVAPRGAKPAAAAAVR